MHNTYDRAIVRKASRHNVDVASSKTNFRELSAPKTSNKTRSATLNGIYGMHVPQHDFYNDTISMKS